MQFQPKTKRELKEMMLLPDGEYDFEVDKAEDKVSKSGNEMVALNLKVWDADGKPSYVRDWLIDLPDNPRNGMKILNFCETTGATEAYEAGNVDANVCQGLTGRVLIGHQESQEFGVQNRVIDYMPSVDQISQDRSPLGVPTSQARVAAKSTEERNAAAVAQGFPEDTIPF